MTLVIERNCDNCIQDIEFVSKTLMNPSDGDVLFSFRQVYFRMQTLSEFFKSMIVRNEENEDAVIVIHKMLSEMMWLQEIIFHPKNPSSLSQTENSILGASERLRFSLKLLERLNANW